MSEITIKMIAYTHGLRDEFEIIGISSYEMSCMGAKDCFERLTDLRWYYLDLDAKAPNDCLAAKFNRDDNNLLEAAKSILAEFDENLSIKSICTSSAYEAKKHSFHFVLDKIGPYSEILNWCQQLNEFSQSKQGPKFDEAVYSEYQLFRSMHCAKPDDPYRIKRKIMGSFEDSLISAGFAHKSPIEKKIFELGDLLQRSNDYNKWLEIGMLLAFYCKERRLHPLSAINTFIEFSNLSETPASEATIIRKFMQCLRTVKSNVYGRIFSTVAQVTNCSLFPNTYGEYLLILAINHYPDFKTRVISTFGQHIDAIYDLLLNAGSFQEHTFYKLLYSLPMVDKSACFTFQETLNVQLFNFLKQLTKIEGDFLNKKFCKHEFHAAVHAREFLNVLLKDVEHYVGELYLPAGVHIPNPFGVIKNIVMSEEEKLWNVQYPYYDALKKLMTLANDNELTFRMLVNRAMEFIFPCEQYFHFFSYVCNDHDAAKVVYNLYPFWRVNYADELYVFDDVHGLWTPKTNIHTYVVTRLANLLYKPAVTKTVENFALSNSLNKKVLERLPSFIELLSRKKEFDDLKYSSVGKILFPNGYYDGYIGTFSPAMYLTDTKLFGEARFLFFNYELYFFASVPDFYIERIDEVQEELVRMKDILFYNMHGKEIGDYHLESLACALFGEKHKGFYVHVGDTNSGKSTEKALIEAAFGEYCGTGNTEDFAVVKNDTREATITNAFVVDNWYKRAVFFSEKGTRTLNTEMLKSHSSGGEDKLRSRKQYGVASIFSIHYKMFFYVNEGLVVNNPNDPAYIDRARYFYWNKSFVPEHEIVDPSCQLPQIPEVQNWKNEQCRRQLFVRIIINSFKDYIHRGCQLPVPESVMLSTREEVGHAMSNDEMFERLMYAFLFTGDSNHIVTRDQIISGCDQLKLAPKKCTQKINSMMAKLGINTIRSSQKTICGERQSVWIGVQIRPVSVSLINEYSPLVNYEKWKEMITDFHGTIPQVLIDSLSNYHAIEETSDYFKYLTIAQQDVAKKRRRYY